ncbi:MAG: hypothetical protein WC374_12370 [Phycisphaerae bacterium]|jgi:hypothetical protein
MKESGNGRYSKWLVPVVIALNVLFSVTLMFFMKNGMAEPTTLIDRWFDFTTVELVAMAGITAGKMGKEVLAGFIEALKNKYTNKKE